MLIARLHTSDSVDEIVLASRPTAVDDQGRARRERCFLRGKVEGGAGDLLWARHPAQWLTRRQTCARLVFVSDEVSRQIRLDERGLHCAWANGVTADTLGGVVNGNRAC